MKTRVELIKAFPEDYKKLIENLEIREKDDKRILFELVKVYMNGESKYSMSVGVLKSFIDSVYTSGKTAQLSRSIAITGWVQQKSSTKD